MAQPLIKLRVTKKRDGREVFWFRDPVGGQRVRTSNPNRQNWVRAQQLRQIAEYGIQLIRERVAKGVGSNDAPMPPLSGRTSAIRREGKFVRQRAAYREWKVNRGGQGIRDLRTGGPGTGGSHMLDDIKVNFVSDQKCTFGIGTRLSRTKALANERRSPWWGWSPSDVRKLAEFARGVLGQSFADYAMSLGFNASRAIAQGGNWLGRTLRRVA